MRFNYIAFLKSLLYSWVFIILGVSMMIYFIYPEHVVVYSKNEVFDFFITLWEIADEIGPAVKLSIVFLFGSLLFVFKNYIFKSRSKLFFFSGLFSIVSISIVLVFLPRNLSRGFGTLLGDFSVFSFIALLYNLVAFLGGLLFAVCYFKLIERKDLWA